ncbi:MAG TPA: hypothetical protein DCQ98_20085 [Planctomycetaceae bacterium]|nr:hypothetical protein [Planctomycetaceae bacterium]HRE99927.1 hypothetical protein [Pirellulaceae bacterium]
MSNSRNDRSADRPFASAPTTQRIDDPTREPSKSVPSDASAADDLLVDAVRRTLLAGSADRLGSSIGELAFRFPDALEPDLPIIEQMVRSVLASRLPTRLLLSETVRWIAEELLADPSASERIARLWRQARERDAQS